MRAVIDTGSGHTLIKESAANKIGSEINKRRNIPNLQGVTGSPLRITGMVWLEIGVGNDHVHKQWGPAVPNSYLDAELLLGTDIIGKAPFQWNGKLNEIVLGNASYVVGHIRRQKGKVEIIRSIPLLARPGARVNSLLLVWFIYIRPVPLVQMEFRSKCICLSLNSGEKFYTSLLRDENKKKCN